MSEAILIKSGGTGTTSDDLTATKNDVLKGTTAVTSDSDDEAIEGTLELTGNALTENVLIGRTFYNIDAHTKLVGAMPNNLEINGELLCGESKTIPLGYTSGGVITAKSLASQTGVDTDKAAADDPQILTGYQAWSNGIKRTGAMINLNSTATITHASNNSTKVILGDATYLSTNSDGVTRVQIRYNSNSGYITSNTLIAVPQATMVSAIGLTAAKLAKGQTVLGVSGSYTSDGTALASHILSGYIAYSNGSKITGTMTNRGAVTSTLNCGGSYTIPAGWHNGSGKVTVNTLASQTSADATAARILSGKTAWVNGSKITGSIGSKAAATYTPGTSNQTIAAGQYLSGAQTIKGDVNLVAANITNGKSIFGVAGSAKTPYKNWQEFSVTSSTSSKSFSVYNVETQATSNETFKVISFNPGGTPVVILCFYLRGFTLYDYTTNKLYMRRQDRTVDYKYEIQASDSSVTISSSNVVIPVATTGSFYLRWAYI